MEGTILKISRFCTEDGPGIRTTVFLKGCPLRCVWCHNPESQREARELWYDEKKCLACGKCVSACSHACHRLEQGVHGLTLQNCIACGACVPVCPGGAMEMVGKRVTAASVLQEVEKDAIFYQTSGGGVTLSGGEPLFQPDFSAEILRLCRERGIHTAIETCGFAGESQLTKVLAYCDYVLFDIKETEEERHLRFTKASLSPILRNLHIVNQRNIPFKIRLPMIPGFNDREAHFAAVKKMADEMKACAGVEVMPYHSLGQYKYGLLQKDYLCGEVIEPDKEQVRDWRHWFLEE